MAQFGASASLRMESSMRLAVRMALSKCGKTARGRLDSGDAELKCRLDVFRLSYLVLGKDYIDVVGMLGSSYARERDSYHKMG